MDPKQVNRLRRNLTLHFAVIAFLTAWLIAMGSEGYFLPVLVLFASLAGYFFVDTLEWFEVGRIGSYVGMTGVTLISIGTYIYAVLVSGSESGQLLSVAGLLVYPECVLFLQKKSQRVFEQLAMFLLLEMLVAALINDNLFFGLLLTPIVLLWVSSLFLFSRYSTLVQLDASIDKPIPLLFEIIYRRYVRPVLGDAQRRSVVKSSYIAQTNVQSSNFLRRGLNTLPIGIGAIAFAAVFFYLMPRTSTGQLRTGLGFAARVGLPTQLRMGVFGRLLQDNTEVMSVTFTKYNSNEKEEYKLRTPPYIRGKIFENYRSTGSRAPGNMLWLVSEGSAVKRKLRSVETVGNMTNLGADLVRVEFDIEKQFAGTLFSVPPAFSVPKPQDVDLRYDQRDMLMQTLDPVIEIKSSTLVYELGSAGFQNGEQSRLLPVEYTNRRELQSIVMRLIDEGTELSTLNEYRMDLLEKLNLNDSGPFAIAEAFQNHFVFSGEFTYSLDLLPQSNPELDPIEDFVVNQKRGHCQYFASALTMLLRQSGIPSRIVVGYRPVQFNSVGSYFRIRQSDAHAWVEGLFTREQLMETPLKKFASASELFWVRFDPTPSSEGGTVEIVEQPGQAISYAEKLWKDYVVDGQKLNTENGLYNPVAENETAYQGVMQRVLAIKDDLQNGRILSSTSGIGFAWPLAILVIILCAMAIALWRLLVILPRIAPRLASRLGLIQPPSTIVSQKFYASCLRILESRGYRRQPHETPQEFMSQVGKILEQAKATPQVGTSLSLLTKFYYDIRFGDAQLSPNDELQIKLAIEQLESAIA